MFLFSETETIEPEKPPTQVLPLPWDGSRQFRVIDKCQSCILVTPKDDLLLPRKTQSCCEIDERKMNKYRDSHSSRSMRLLLKGEYGGEQLDELSVTTVSEVSVDFRDMH